MDVFQYGYKLWPTGQPLPQLGSLHDSFAVPHHISQNASKFASDGTQTYEFLFWNTGRHVTTNRSFVWNFSVGSWGLWEATAWYGIPVGGPGELRVRVDPFTIGGDAPIIGQGTAISKNSTYAPGAFPFNGDDHEIGTANGPAVVYAQDVFAGLSFAGWLRLIWGGDDRSSLPFVETDTGPAPGAPDFFGTVSAGTAPFNESQNGSDDLLALYGNRVVDLWNPRYRLQPFEYGDLFVGRLVKQAAWLPSGLAGVELESIQAAAPQMTVQQVNRAITTVQAVIDLGTTTLASLQSQLNREEQ